jgi:hypothetical protein
VYQRWAQGGFTPAGVLGLVAFLLWSASPVRVQAGPVAYVAGNFGVNFGTMDLSTGTFQQTNPNISFIVEGMGFAPDGYVYSIGYTADNTDHVFRINPSGGTVTDLGSLGPNVQFNNGTTNKAGTLYAIDDNTGLLYTISTQTLAVTPIGSTGLGSNHGRTPDGLLAFDANGNLFADEFRGLASDLLDKIDPTTGALTPIGTGLFSRPFPSIYAGVFIQGTLYGFGVDFGSQGPMDQNVYTINTTTGLATFVTPYSLPSNDDVLAAAAPPVPEPSSWLLLGFGAMALVAHRQCRALDAKGRAWYRFRRVRSFLH